ncbi:MAG TPA: BTAD domain-containing putative transcriptional regulator [Acidimicrobiales bacterium]
MRTPGRAAARLVEAIERCRAEGDVDAELAAVAQLGLDSWTSQDARHLVPHTDRVAALAEEGHPVARAMMALRDAFAADIAGDDHGVLDHLGRIEPGVLPGVSDVTVPALAAGVHLGLGRPERTLEVVERAAPRLDPAVRWLLEAMGVPALQVVGRVDEAHAATDRLVRAARASGIQTVRFLVTHAAVLVCAHVGDVEGARRHLEEARTTFRRGTRGRPQMAALATASLAVAEGDEAAAADVLAETIARRGIDRGLVRRWWRFSLGFTYVVSPEARAHWEAVPLHGQLAMARQLAQLVVRVREGGPAALRHVGFTRLDLVRGSLHHRHAAELAVALAAEARAEGPALLDVLGRPGREVVRALGQGSRQARDARALLAAAPAPPRRPTYVAALGPLELRRDGRDGEVVDHPDLRRHRVQALLTFLLHHRQTTRSVIAAALWPHMTERAAANNLAVTLNRVSRLLDPWRAAGDPPYQLRLDGPSVRLVCDEHLRVDIDELDAHRAAAAQAEQDNEPMAELEHHLAAVALHRGDLCAGLPDAPWLTLPREHHRSRFVHSAVRAAQLLLAQDDIDEAARIAARALEVDPASEKAHAVLIEVALARDDRAEARRLLRSSLDALAALGIEPSSRTEELRRRVSAALRGRRSPDATTGGR